MEASKELFVKVLEYQKKKLETESLRQEIKDLLEKEYLEKTGFTLCISTFEPFISDSTCGKKEEETGIYCKEKQIRYKRSSKCWYAGKEFIPIEGSDKFIGYEYER